MQDMSRTHNATPLAPARIVPTPDPVRRLPGLVDGAPESSPCAIAPGELGPLLSGLLAVPSLNDLVVGVAIASPLAPDLSLTHTRARLLSHLSST